MYETLCSTLNKFQINYELDLESIYSYGANSLGIIALSRPIGPSLIEIDSTIQNWFCIQTVIKRTIISPSQN